MRVMIIGICQNIGIANAVKMMLPLAHVEIITVSAVDRFSSASELLAYLSDFDQILCQNFSSPIFGELTPQIIRRELPRTTIIPIVYFAGFFPDQVTLQATHADGRRELCVDGAMETYHSALVIFSYLNGFSRRQATKLFQRDAFEAVGYFDFWDESQQFLLDEFKRSDFDGRDLFFDWVRDGVFMYVNNHPNAMVLADVAYQGLRQAGLSLARPHRAATYLADPYNHIVWPIYPEIGLDLGIDGGYLFKAPRNHTAESKYMDLDQFIDESYCFYETLVQGSLTCDRASVWQDDKVIKSILTEISN